MSPPSALAQEAVRRGVQELQAQARSLAAASCYERVGFVRSGAEQLVDGLPHVGMRRAP